MRVVHALLVGFLDLAFRQDYAATLVALLLFLCLLLFLLLLAAFGFLLLVWR